MALAFSGAGFDRASAPLLDDTFEVSPRLRLRRKKNPAPALAALGLGSAMAFGAAEAAAKTKTIMQNGESYFNVGELNAQQLPSGAMEITFSNGQKIVIPAGEYGYSHGDLFISEKHMPYELAHAVMTPQQIDGYVFSKTSTAEGLSPISTATPDTYTVVRPTYLTQLTAAGVIVLAGAAAWYVLTKIGDAPEFEYPIYTTTFEENDTGTVYTAQAKDLDSPALIYSLRDDNDEYDNEFFEIDSSSGELTFITPPNFEAPADDNENNVYDVKIDATDSDGGIGSMLLHVTVSDQATETTALTPANNAGTVNGTNSSEDAILSASGYSGLTLAMGAGQDYVEIASGANFTGTSSSLSTGADDDLVVIEQTAANTVTPTIDLGGGNDVVELNTSNAGNYAISLGTGTDTVRIGVDSLTTGPSISLFTSDDTLDLSALSLTTIDTNSDYANFAAAEAALAGASGADIAYFTAGSDTTVLIDTDADGSEDITINLLGVTNFDTDSIML